MKKLTAAEEEIMQVIWQLKKAFVKDIIEQLPPPKPAYNTVSTIVRILESKGFVAHQAYGKSHEYYPLIDKATYTQSFLEDFVGSYFGGSFEKLVSFFVSRNDVDIREMEKILAELKKNDRDAAH